MPTREQCPPMRRWRLQARQPRQRQCRAASDVVFPWFSPSSDVVEPGCGNYRYVQRLSTARAPHEPGGGGSAPYRSEVFMRHCAWVLIGLALAAPAAAQDSSRQVWVTQSGSGEIVSGRIVDLSA